MDLNNPAAMEQKADELAQAPGELAQILTPSGPVAVFGSHLVHPKLLGIVGALLNLEEWTHGKVPGPGIHSIVFRGDGVPTKTDKDVYASSYFNTLSMAINLRYHFDASLKLVVTEEPALSVRSALWHNLLTSICHEIHHVAVAASLRAGDVWSEQDYKDEEESAKEWARDKIVELAQSGLDIEPPPFNEEPFFGFLFMAANVERVQSGADEAIWDNQLKMLAESWTWHDPSDGMTCHTWKDYINTNIQEVDKDATSVEAVDELNIKIINKDTGAESNVITADPTDVVPAAAAVTQTESTFVRETPTADILQDVKQAFTPVAEETTTDISGINDPELLDLIENDVEDYSPHADSAFAEVTQPAQANVPPFTVFTGPQTTVAEQPVHTPTPPIVEERQAFNPEAVRQTTQLLFQRLFAHIFTKCQPVNGVFANPTAIFEPVPITDIPGIEILVGMDTINETGQFKKNMLVQGFIKGQIFQKSKLPAYHIYLNVGGVIHQRRLVPQNIQTGSGPAQEAAAGNHIGWIIDAAETDKNAAFKFKYVNGVITPC